MRKIFLGFLIVLSAIYLTGCAYRGKYLSSWYNAETSKALISVYNCTVTDKQLDSICIADTLSKNLAKWNRSFYIDFETLDTIYKFTFIKGDDTYILSNYKDSMVINKRTIKRYGTN